MALKLRDDGLFRPIFVVQLDLGLLYGEDGDEHILRTKIGTILTLAVLSKWKKGVLPKDYTAADWKEVADSVSKYAVEMEGDDYSRFVFQLYAQCIDASAQFIETKAAEGKVSEEKVKEIYALAEELREKSSQFEKHEIREVDYVEDCLWISLEAMIKLLSAELSLPGGKEVNMLKDSLAMFAFEYGRLALYKKEQVAIDELLEHQQDIDAELEEKYKAFLKDLAEESARFTELIDNAFAPDFQSRVEGSIALAEEVGVPEDEILRTLDDVDAFFM